MNLDYLISKYLDGELNQVEDSLLRSKLSEDKSSKDAFDSAVMLHLACKDDADSIILPKALKRDTEDKILMKILSQQEIVMDRPVKTKKVFSYSTVIAAFLLLFIFKIYDNSFYSPNTIAHILKEERNLLTQDYNENVEFFASLDIKDTKGNIDNINQGFLITEANSVDNSSNFAINNVVANKNISNENNLASSDFENKPNEIKSENVNTNIATDEFIAAQTTANSKNPVLESEKNQVPSFTANIIDMMDNKLMQNNNTKEKSVVILNNQFDNQPIVNSLNEDKSNVPNLPASLNNIARDEKIENWDDLDFYKETSEIQVTSFFGTDFVRGNIEANNNTYITHFSQSVAYPINPSNRIGVELGYTEYAYNEESKVKTPVNINARTPGVVESTDIIFPTSNDVDYMLTLFTYSQKKQIFWGAAFYEYSLFESSHLSMNGRLGVGSSKEGPMGYGRLFAKYEVLGGVYLTLGTEGRMFVAGLPMMTKTQSDFKTTASVIYGFQVKF